MLWALPGNGRCLHSHRIETGLFFTIGQNVLDGTFGTFGKVTEMHVLAFLYMSVSVPSFSEYTISRIAAKYVNEILCEGNVIKI
jgi:hypothetical protein